MQNKRKSMAMISNIAQPQLQSDLKSYEARTHTAQLRAAFLWAKNLFKENSLIQIGFFIPNLLDHAPMIHAQIVQHFPALKTQTIFDQQMREKMRADHFDPQQLNALALNLLCKLSNDSKPFKIFDGSRAPDNAQLDALWVCDAGALGWQTHASGSAHQNLHTDLMRLAPRTVLSYISTENRPDTVCPLLIENNKAVHPYTPEATLEQAVQMPGIKAGQARASHAKPLSNRLLSLQAQCPFHGYTEDRIKLEEAEEPPQNRFSLQDRGMIVHALLANLWLDLKTQDALLARSDEDLNAQVNALCGRMLSEHAGANGLDCPETYLKREQTFLVESLIQPWLNLEKKRSPFEIYQLEKSYTFRLAQTEIHVRIDRIDQTPDGKLIILDYKTGLANTNQWLEPRLTDTQIPLYALCVEQPIAAIAYGALAEETSYFSGIQDHSDRLPGRRIKTLDQIEILSEPSWEALKERWHRQLLDLQGELLQGKSDVQPLAGERSCQFCQLASLCRVKCQ